jgi:regulation of enolase protein 1 (concanavalin A-like superfamily)
VSTTNIDFWQRTHYGFEADNGQILFAPVAGDFVLATQVRFHPVHQYDQAGLMVRVSPSGWLKTSAEYEPIGPSRLAAVVTNDTSSD